MSCATPFMAAAGVEAQPLASTLESKGVSHPPGGFDQARRSACTFGDLEPVRHAQSQTLAPRAVQDSIRDSRRNPVTGAGDRRKRRHLLAVQRNAAAAAAG